MAEYRGYTLMAIYCYVPPGQPTQFGAYTIGTKDPWFTADSTDQLRAMIDAANEEA